MTTSETPIGTVIATMGTRPTNGKWLRCDGEAYRRYASAMKKLFAVIGTRFGSKHGSSFCVSDLRGKDETYWIKYDD